MSLSGNARTTSDVERVKTESRGTIDAPRSDVGRRTRREAATTRKQYAYAIANFGTDYYLRRDSQRDGSQFPSIMNQRRQDFLQRTMRLVGRVRRFAIERLPD